MKITVITPTFNSEKTITKCVKSVIGQSYKYFEHIVVDNMSADSTINIVSELYKSNNLQSNLQIISEKDNGIAEAFNKGIEKSSGDIITILNSDDYYYHDNVFEEVIKKISVSEKLFVHGDILFVDNTYGSNIRKPLLCDLRKAMPYNHPTMFVRKSVYQSIGLFNKRYRYAMDYEFVCRMYKRFGDLKNVSYYLPGNPMVVMSAGGASWQYERASLRETKVAQIENELWTFSSQYFYLIRLLRIRLKKIFDLLGLNYLIKIWRNLKWN